MPRAQTAPRKPARAAAEVETLRPGAARPADPAAPGLADPLAVFDACERSLEMTRAAHLRWIDRCGAINRALADFVGRRLDAEFEAARHLALARSLPEAATIWTGFVQTAARDYAEEARALGGLATELARDTVRTARSEVDALTEPGREPRID